MSNPNTQSAEGHTYKGWTACTEPERDGDGFTAIYFYAQREDGARQPLNWSRFADLTASQFEALVDRGFPHSGTGSWTPESFDRFVAGAAYKALAA